MSHNRSARFVKAVSRCRLLGWGSDGLVLTAVSIAAGSRLPEGDIRVPPQPQKYQPPAQSPFDPMTVLRDFDYGQIKQENGRTIQDFEVTASSTVFQLNSAIPFVGWMLNQRIPAPTLRAKAGDRVRVIFHNQDGLFSQSALSWPTSG